DQIVCMADKNHPSIDGEIKLDQYLALPHIRFFGSGKTTTTRVIDTAVARLGAQLFIPFWVQSLATMPAAIVGSDVIATVPRTFALRASRDYPLQVLTPPLHFPKIRYAAY